jgi:hypothetical protein
MKKAIAIYLVLVAAFVTLVLNQKSLKDYPKFAPYEGNFMMFLVKTAEPGEAAMLAKAAQQNPVPQIVTTRKVTWSYGEGEAMIAAEQNVTNL